MKTYSEFGFYKTIRSHLLKQGVVSQTNHPFEPKCKYRLVRDDRLLMCAIGCTITAEYYQPWMDKSEQGPPVDQLTDADVGYNLSEVMPLAVALQVFHDTVDPDYWPIVLPRLTHWDFIRMQKVAAESLRNPRSTTMTIRQQVHDRMREEAWGQPTYWDTRKNTDLLRSLQEENDVQ